MRESVGCSPPLTSGAMEIRNMQTNNIFASIPSDLKDEVFEDIIRSPNVRVERVVSKGQTSADVGWYDQDEHEWVLVLKGSAILEFDDGSICKLSAGDYLNIPAHARHRVSWTDPDVATVWLAIFYK